MVYWIKDDDSSLYPHFNILRIFLPKNFISPLKQKNPWRENPQTLAINISKPSLTHFNTLTSPLALLHTATPLLLVLGMGQGNHVREWPEPPEPTPAVRQGGQPPLSSLGGFNIGRNEVDWWWILAPKLLFLHQFLIKNPKQEALGKKGGIFGYDSWWVVISDVGCWLDGDGLLKSVDVNSKASFFSLSLSNPRHVQVWTRVMKYWMMMMLKGVLWDPLCVMGCCRLWMVVWESSLGDKTSLSLWIFIDIRIVQGGYSYHSLPSLFFCLLAAMMVYGSWALLLKHNSIYIL